MSTYIWLLPVIFIFHDMEEIVGAEKWIRNNYGSIITKYPRAEKLIHVYRGVTTSAFAAAVYEELILLIVICLAAGLTDISLLDGLWFGGLTGFTLHLLIHIGQAVLIRSYIPSLITSLLSLPPSIWLICKCTAILTFDAPFVIGMLTGIFGIAVNLKLAHILMLRLSAK